jgi:Skp family chaperone for outer membrane proteins
MPPKNKFIDIERFIYKKSYNTNHKNSSLEDNYIHNSTYREIFSLRKKLEDKEKELIEKTKTQQELEELQKKLNEERQKLEAERLKVEEEKEELEARKKEVRQSLIDSAEIKLT